MSTTAIVALLGVIVVAVLAWCWYALRALRRPDLPEPPAHSDTLQFTASLRRPRRPPPSPWPGGDEPPRAA